MSKVAALQMASTADVQHNLNQIETGLEQAQAQGAELLVCPEECLTLGMTDSQKFEMSEDSRRHTDALAAIASKHNMWLIAGSVPMPYDKQRYSSSCLVFDTDGAIVTEYQKIHLFDVQVDDKTSFKESDTVKAGDDVVVVETPIGMVGLSICYDVRFPYLYQRLSDKGAQIIVIPSAFTPQTGKVHWDLLVRARAVENLCYVVAPNQCGVRANGEGTYGHSCIVHPWGEVLSQAQDEPELIIGTIDLEAQAKIRREFPAISHRRYDLRD